MHPPLCKNCNRFTSNVKFDNYCSLCLLEKNPEKYMDLFYKLKMGPDNRESCYYSEPYLAKYTATSSIDNKCMRILSYSISKINAKAFFDMALKLFEKENKKGISANQGKFLLKKYQKSPIFSPKKYKGYQNLIGGLIIDWWNINGFNNGQIASCNWGTSGMRPLKSHPIRPPAYKIKINKYYPYLPFSYQESIQSII